MLTKRKHDDEIIVSNKKEKIENTSPRIFESLPHDINYLILTFIEPKYYLPLLLINRSAKAFIQTYAIKELSKILRPNAFKSSEKNTFTLYYQHNRLEQFADRMYKLFLKANDNKGKIYIYTEFSNVYWKKPESEFTRLALTQTILKIYNARSEEDCYEESDYGSKFPIQHCLAAMGSNLEVVLALIKNGFDIHRKDSENQTFLEVMFEYDNNLRKNLDIVLPFFKNISLSNLQITDQIRHAVAEKYILYFCNDFKDYAPQIFSTDNSESKHDDIDQEEKMALFIDLFDEANHSIKNGQRSFSWEFCKKFIEVIDNIYRSNLEIWKVERCDVQFSP